MLGPAVPAFGLPWVSGRRADRAAAEIFMRELFQVVGDCGHEKMKSRCAGAGGNNIASWMKVAQADGATLALAAVRAHFGWDRSAQGQFGPAPLRDMTLGMNISLGPSRRAMGTTPLLPGSGQESRLRRQLVPDTFEDTADLVDVQWVTASFP